MTESPLPATNCPEPCRVTGNVPMVHVADVDVSVRFYAQLGFECDGRFSRADGVTNWASLVSAGGARIMFARASGPIVAEQQAVLFYMYSRDVAALRLHLLASGLPDGGAFPCGESGAGAARDEARGPVPPRNAVFTPMFPFYMPEGEIRIHDPDGYVVLVGQMER